MVDPYEERRETLIKILSSLYDKAAAYTNIIMAAGYAGFFAVWSNMKTYMTDTEMRVSALTMLISLLVFVLWEVSKMIITSRNLHGLLNVINALPIEFEQKLKQQQLAEAKLNISLFRAWKIVLIFSIVPGLIGSGILIYSFVAHL